MRPMPTTKRVANILIDEELAKYGIRESLGVVLRLNTNQYMVVVWTFVYEMYTRQVLNSELIWPRKQELDRWEVWYQEADLLNQRGKNCLFIDKSVRLALNYT